ncbi:MAG: MFS transporter [Gammaproteobacteria bacterium]|nr:MFS transporter [Gammaproteobacteria bacterium]
MADTRRNLAHIFAVDLILRWAYQMAKTPLLPLFAAVLGASEMMTGMIVAVSTFTGMILKPLFGMLSDRWGRRIWLLVALCLFTTVPFLYRLVSSPQELFWLRLIHGFATAILGPVSLAYVADLGRQDRATRLAVFGMARAIAGLGAPLCTGLALVYLDIQSVLTLTGFLSLAAAIPIVLLDEKPASRPAAGHSLSRQALSALINSIGTAAIWLAGILELIANLVTYAIRAFLPLFILSQENGTILQAGLFFSLQEAAHIVLRPIGGRLADRWGFGLIIWSGLLVMAAGLALLPVLPGFAVLVAALLTGAAQALIFPASVALLVEGTKPRHRGAGMGFYGALRNTGKVVGPVLAGLLLTRFDFASVFITSSLIIAAAALIGGAITVARRRT